MTLLPHKKFIEIEPLRNDPIDSLLINPKIKQRSISATEIIYVIYI